MTIAYLNGSFIPLAQAQVSAMDRGFLFGDSVYEVIPVYHDRAFRVDEHLRRLNNSLAAIQLTIPLSADDWKKIFTALVEKNGGGEQAIYLQCTRGADITRDFPIPTNLKPTVFAYSYTIPPKSIDELKVGATAITVQDIRWLRCDIKATTLLGSVLMRQQAVVAGAHEAILIRDGFAVEGTATNLFIVKDNVIITPPRNNLILGGITREVVIELCSAQRLPFREAPITSQELATADEIWITSSTREVKPVTVLDNKPVGSGKTGAVWYKMIEHYHNFIKSI